MPRRSETLCKKSECLGLSKKRVARRKKARGEIKRGRCNPSISVISFCLNYLGTIHISWDTQKPQPPSHVTLNKVAWRFWRLWYPLYLIFFPACGGPTPLYLDRDAIFISVTQKRHLVRPPSPSRDMWTVLYILRNLLFSSKMNRTSLRLGNFLKFLSKIHKILPSIERFLTIINKSSKW